VRDSATPFDKDIVQWTFDMDYDECHRSDIHACNMGVNQQAHLETETEVMGEISGTLQATVDSVNGTPTTHTMLDETFTGSGGQ
jgi:hypothetical protein